MDQDFALMAKFLNFSGLSDREIARRVGTDGPMIARIRRNGVIPRHDIAMALKKVFDERYAEYKLVMSVFEHAEADHVYCPRSYNFLMSFLVRTGMSVDDISAAMGVDHDYDSLLPLNGEVHHGRLINLVFKRVNQLSDSYMSEDTAALVTEGNALVELTDVFYNKGSCSRGIRYE